MALLLQPTPVILPAAVQRCACLMPDQRACHTHLSPWPPCAGYDGFSWPPNALLIAGFSAKPPSDLAPVFGDRIATVEDRFAA